MNNNTRSFEIGTIDPRTDVKVGDLVQVRIGAGQFDAQGKAFEIPVINTFEVESVDVLGKGKLWCRGRIVDTDYHTPDAFIGRGAMAFLGEV
jgi:hypothetical protein